MKHTFIILITACSLILFTSCKNEQVGQKDTNADIIKKEILDDSGIENEIINHVFSTLIDSLEINNIFNFSKEIQKTNTLFYFDSLLEPRYDNEELKNICLDHICIDSLEIKFNKVRFEVFHSQIKGKKISHLSSRIEVDSMKRITKNSYILFSFTNFAFNKDYTIGIFIFDLGYSFRIGTEFLVLTNKQGSKWKIFRIIRTTI